MKRTFQPNRSRRPNARLPRTHEHQEWTPGPEAPPRQGPQAPDGLVGVASGEPPVAQESRVTERLQPHERVRRRTDFEHIYEHGAKRHGRFMTMFVLAREPVPTDTGQSRFGVAATRKLGGAVVRNRAKRLSRELFRRHKPAASLDVVVVPRREFLSADFPSLERDYVVLLSGRGGRDAGPTTTHRARRTLTWPPAPCSGSSATYQLLLSPWSGGACRFTPSCSAYAIESLERYGAWRGGWMALKRLARCHPWGPAGFNPVR